MHEFPVLQNGLLKKIIVSQRSIDMSHDPLCKSREVATDNQQIGKSKASGGNGKSKSKGKIEGRHDVSEISVVGQDVSEISVVRHDVESCIANSSNGKARGGNSISKGMQRHNDNNDDNNDDDDACTVWRSCVAGNPPPLGKGGGRRSCVPAIRRTP